MKSKRRIFSFVVILLVITVTACGKSIEESDTSQETATDDTELNEIQTDVEPEPEPESQYWGEENEISYTSERSFSKPIYNVALEERDGDLLEDGICEPQEGTVEITSAEVSDADEEGYVIYTIMYHSESPYKLTTSSYEAYANGFAWYCGNLGFIPMDYYTGTVFPYVVQDVFIDLNNGERQASADYGIATDVTVDDKTYSVSESVSDDFVVEDNKWEDFGNGSYEFSLMGKCNELISIKAPKDYDGLILAFYCEYQEYSGPESVEQVEAHILGEGEDENPDISKYKFIRVSDLLSTEE